MSIQKRRRETEVFSMAFLDCITCGFGATLLVFVLTVAQRENVIAFDIVDEENRFSSMVERVRTTEEDLQRLANLLAAAQIDLEAINAKTDVDQLRLSDRQKELLLLLNETGSMEEALARLLAEKAALPTQETKTLPIPNVDRTQYLTGVKMDGDYVVFVVEASGSMLDETIETAADRLRDTDVEKRNAPKWRRVVESVQWMIATLDPETYFQILVFSDEVRHLLPARGDQWFTRTDREVLSEIVVELDDIVPNGRANMERAFDAVRYLSHVPDNILLFTDGTPTQSDTAPVQGEATEAQRVRFFRFAIAKLPPRIPISTILFPMSGDPAGPSLLWKLARERRGALVSPSRNWPAE
jgi:hypothetical protein